MANFASYKTMGDNFSNILGIKEEKSSASMAITEKKSFSYSIIDADLTPRQRELATFIDNLKESIKEIPSLIILKGPHISKSSIESTFENLHKKYKVLIQKQAEIEKAPLFGFFSSGTTGNPKLIIHKQASLIKSAKTSSELMGLSKETPLLSALPFYHVGGFLCLLRHLIFNCPFYWNKSHELYDPITKGLTKGRNVIVVAVPAQIEFLPTKATSKFFKADHSLTIYSGGDAVKEKHWDRCDNQLTKLIATYGQTESCGAILYQNSYKKERGPITPCRDVEVDFVASTNESHLLSYKTQRLAFAIIDGSEFTVIPPHEFYLTKDLVEIRAKDKGKGKGKGKDDKDNPHEFEISSFIGRIDNAFQCGGELINPKILENKIVISLKDNNIPFNKIQVVGIPHQRLGHIPVGFIEGIDPRDFEVLLSIFKKTEVSVNNPGRLRGLAQWPTHKGLKPAQIDFILTFESCGKPL